MAESVHFRDLESAVAAVKNTGYEAWSVWEKNFLLCKGIGTDDLNAFLELLAESSTNAIYTVRYYAKIADKDDIKNNTPHDGAFKFRLNSDGQEVTQSQYGVIRHNNELASRVAGIESNQERILKILEEETIEDREKPNSLGVIGEILAHPAIQPMIQPFLSSLLLGTSMTPGQSQQRPAFMQPATVGNIPNDKELLESSLRVLQEQDPRYIEHIAKLANIAVTDPQTFKMILASLDGYTIQT